MPSANEIELKVRPAEVTGLSRGQRKRHTAKSRLANKRKLGQFADELKTAKKQKERNGNAASRQHKPFHSFTSDMAATIDAIADENRQTTDSGQPTGTSKGSSLTATKRQKLRKTEIERFNAILGFKPFVNDPVGAMTLHLKNTVGVGKSKPNAKPHRRNRQQKELLVLDTHVKLRKHPRKLSDKRSETSRVISHLSKAIDKKKGNGNKKIAKDETSLKTG